MDKDVIKIIDKNYEHNAYVTSQIVAYIDVYNVELQKIIQTNLNKVSDIETRYSIFLNHLLFDGNEYYLNNYLLNNIKLLNTQTFKNNPYYKNITFSSFCYGDVELKKITYKPFMLFPYGEINVDGYKETNPMGFFTQPFSFPTLFQDKREWMMINPNEIITMQESIDQAYGNVLTFGLGVGYFAYMVSLKDNVNTITIVEKDPKIISIFKKVILPQFEYKQKIIIINDDAIEYMKKTKKPYDFTFGDIWHDAIDGVTLYIKMKQNEKKMQCSKFNYWIEKTILYRIRYYIYIVIFDLMDGLNKTYHESILNIIKSYFLKLPKLDYEQYLSIDYIKNIFINNLEIN